MRKFQATRAAMLLGMTIMLAAAGAVSAKTTNLHTVSDGTYSFGDLIEFGNSFTDHVRFKLDDAAQVSSFVKSFDLSFAKFDLIGIDSFSASLQRLGQGGFQTIGSFSGNTISFDDLLNPGTYRLTLTGTASGLIGGMYRGTLNVAAVPEADTWIMLLVGAALVIYQLRRKQRSLEQQQSLLA